MIRNKWSNGLRKDGGPGSGPQKGGGSKSPAAPHNANAKEAAGKALDVHPNFPAERAGLHAQAANHYERAHMAGDKSAGPKAQEEHEQAAKWFHAAGEHNKAIQHERASK